MNSPIQSQRSSNQNKQLELYFKLANIFAMSGWLTLALLPNWQYSARFVLYVSFILLALLYIFLLQKAMRTKPERSGENKTNSDKPSFNNLRGVMALLKNPIGGLAAWVHILAFDLMMGLYIHDEGAVANISHWYLLPCYFFTLMLGPIGVLMFLGLKFFMGV